MNTDLYVLFFVVVGCAGYIFLGFVYSMYKKLRMEVDYLKNQVSSLQKESHKNWQDIHKVSRAAGLTWVPAEEGKWVKE